MGWLQAIILGISQGLTEFLPVSSSGHEMVINHLFHWKDGGAAFSAITQLGTEAAVLIYFRKDIIEITRAWFLSLRKKEHRSDPHARMGWYVIVGTLPIAVIGVVLKDFIETDLRNLWVVASALIIVGLLIFLVDAKAQHVKVEEDINTNRALTFGFAQALALIPGVSRSGGTIAAGLAMGFKREVAARYSFLLAIPAVLASSLLELPKLGDPPGPNEVATNWPATLVSTVIAFIVGYVVITKFMHYIASRTFTPFVIYRVVLGVVLLGLLATNHIVA